MVDYQLTINTMQDTAKKLYTMLKFQYEPIEKRIKENAPDLYKQYLTFPYARRIAILDSMHAKGL